MNLLPEPRHVGRFGQLLTRLIERGQPFAGIRVDERPRTPSHTGTRSPAWTRSSCAGHHT